MIIVNSFQFDVREPCVAIQDEHERSNGSKKATAGRRGEEEKG